MIGSFRYAVAEAHKTRENCTVWSVKSAGELKGVTAMEMEARPLDNRGPLVSVCILLHVLPTNDSLTFFTCIIIYVNVIG